MSALNPLAPPVCPPAGSAPRALATQRWLPPATRALQRGWLRRGLILAVLALAWELLARWQGSAFLLPGLSHTARALAAGYASGALADQAGASLLVLLQGYAGGALAAFLLTALAVSTPAGRDLLATLTSMFNALPAIALLPLALPWFGLGRGSLVFVLVHAVLWPLAASTLAGLQAVPRSLRMAARGYGLRGMPYVLQILLPAALPAILSGLKAGWGLAWRTLLAAELVVGAFAGEGGPGWSLLRNGHELSTDRVLAALALVTAIGLAVEGPVFRALERVTGRRWGLQG